MSRQVPYYRHDLQANDAEKIARVLQSPILTSGSVGKEVEAQLAQFFGTKHAGLVNSWTNGALAALLAMDIRQGDEVIVPAMTFIASANIVELVGARPIFIDVEPDTLLISFEHMLDALTPATKAIIPVHLYGQMVDIRRMRAVLAEAGRPDIKIIEDSAHCVEGRFDDFGPGAYSDISLFSFYATKNLTCGEGGAYVTNSDDLANKMVQTRLHGMSGGAADRYSKGSYRHWDMARLGTKANLPDILAALLPHQIATLRERLAVRQKLAACYENGLRGTPIRIAKVVQGALSARHIFAIHVTPSIRDEAIAIFNASGIGVTVNFRSVPTMTYYREKYRFTPESFPVSYEWGEGTITLPFFPSMTQDDQNYVINIIRTKIIPLF